MMQSFHFLRPWWLLALLLLPLLAILIGRRVRGGGAWQQFVEPALLPFVLEHNAGKAARWVPWLALPAAALMVLALAGPAWQQLPQPVFHGQSPLVIALDLSRSMDAADLSPSRAARGRLKVLDILNQRKDGQTALLAFAADAFIVSPLTDDGATIASMVPSLEPAIMPSQGSNVAAALGEAAELLEQAGVARGDVLVLTDSPADAEALQTARRLSALGHRLSVMAIGTEEGAPVLIAQGGLLRDRDGNIVVARLDAESLASLAMAGGGAFSMITVDNSDLVRLLPADGSMTGAVEADGDLRTDQWREEGPWLLLPLLPLGALLFRKGLVVCLLLFCVPWPVQAASFADLWRTPDQRGAVQFDAQAPEAAAKLFDNPEWRAAANFRAGDYAQSAADLDGIDTPRAHYNRGNALALAGNLGEAVQAYERALELDPDHEDARYNLDQLMQQNEEQQAQDQQGDGESEQQQDSESSADNNSAGESGQQGEQSQEDSEAGEQQQAQEGEQDSPSESQADDQEPGDAEDAEQSQQAEAQDADEDEQQGDAAQASVSDESLDEDAQSAELWLRRIPDDPGGLLRRKLLYQHRERARRGDAPEQEPW